jgi:hypothetical protein
MFGYWPATRAYLAALAEACDIAPSTPLRRHLGERLDLVGLRPLPRDA